MYELRLDHPFAGTWMSLGLLRGESRQISRAHVITLIKRMRIEAIYRRQNTSPHPVYRLHPHLLRGSILDGPDQALAMDVSYNRVKHDFVYLAAAVDWHTRQQLALRASITMAVAFCLKVVEQPIALANRPNAPGAY
ncbi:MAG: hypothetical protein Q7T25_15890 [Sideroxyarcus sp.]|nr:hypothetical protein [Sideroxyarcus sp.]